MRTKKKKKPSESSPSTTRLPPTSFSSLPYDLVLNILARVSIFQRPTLSLVSKSFRSVIASPELEVTRALIGKTDDCLYVCLNLNWRNPNPLWFALAPIPNQQKLMPIPSCPYGDHKSSTVVSIGSEIYIIGGYTMRRASKSVFLLDCRSHQWSTVENMRVGRQKPAAEVICGKIYVTGGCMFNQNKDWGEVYDPKTQTWEPLLPKALNLPIRKSVVQGRLDRMPLVEVDKNVFCQISVSYGRKLIWRDAKEKSEWSDVMGLEGMPVISKRHSYLVSMKNSCGGRIVTILWKMDSKIWCAEISFERRSFEELWGFVEWSKSVFDGAHDSDSNFFLHSALVKL